MNILLSSYSFGAYRGSEAGVGWNVAKGLAQRGHQVTVLTTSEFTQLNHPAIISEKLPIRIIEQDFGISLFASSSAYRLWQKKVGTCIRSETEHTSYDLIHHVTFNQYRNISDVFATNLPYIIGPIGGAELIPVPLLQYGNLPLPMRIKEIIRYCPWDARPLIRNCRQHPARGIVLTSNESTTSRLRKLSCQINICPAIAIHQHEIIEAPAPTTDKTPFILFDGGLSRPQKGTWLALRALARLWQNGTLVPIRMVGISAADATSITQYAAMLGLPAQALQLHPPVSRNTMLQWMQEACIMLSTVYRDSGSMALLEALAQGCRIVCLDIPSQNWLPNDFARKISIRPTSPEMEQAISHAIHEEINSTPHTPEWHRKRVQWLSCHMTWDARLNELEEHYRAVLAQVH